VVILTYQDAIKCLVYLKGITIMVNQINKPIAVEPKIEKAVIAWGRGETKLIDVLREEGKVWTDFLSPKNSLSTCTQEYYDNMKLVMAKMLGQEELYLEDKTNNEPRNRLVSKCTSKLKDMRRLLKPKAEKGDPRSDLELLMSDLDKAQKRLMENEEMFTHHDQVVIAMEELFNTIERSA